MVTRAGNGRPRICSNSSRLATSSSKGSAFRREVSWVTCRTRCAIARNSGLWMRIRCSPDMSRSCHDKFRSLTGDRVGSREAFMAGTAFAGFPVEALDFFDGLAQDNSKAYWEAHKQEYERAVAGPLRNLAESLAPEFGEAKIFRPYRDVRFRTDKRPYQEYAALATHGTETGLLYLRLETEGLMLAGGWYQPDTETLNRFRTAISDPDIAA